MSRIEIKEIKSQLKPGTRIRLDEWGEADPNPIAAGTYGVVNHVDDAGQIHVAWDNGRFLAISPEYGDKYTVIDNRD